MSVHDCIVCEQVDGNLLIAPAFPMRGGIKPESLRIPAFTRRSAGTPLGYDMTDSSNAIEVIAKMKST